MSKISVFKRLDQVTFGALNKLKDSTEYTKLMDQYNSFDENIQESIRGTIMLLLFAIPLIILFLFKWSNISLEKDLQTRNLVVSSANEIIQTTKTIQTAERQHIGKRFVDNKSAFQQILSGAARVSNVDLNKISVGSFEKFDQAGNIIQIETDIKYTGITNEQLFNFINHLSEKSRMKFDKVSIKKNSSNNLLEGIFTALYYSKLVESDDDE